ncbi:MAG: hypothetical protein A2Z21_01020 [Candidatus Fraserbacteria bacterium RBG_16_55_9]|uniref:Uncharacterized protein n=1 Tax=Fraserbacteria sp. (strain RBG_16_55_9) TaxID=1817864 RepID=A0A1F5URM5_FRAXR|nr:MAG: hypothetical protein A2Z21_01020 [Candidatus Fraserbacteria bacterium RBG_16_55_9]
MKWAVCALLAVVMLAMVGGTSAWGQTIQFLGGPGVMSDVEGISAIVDWRLAGEVRFLSALGARGWLMFGEGLDGIGWGVALLWHLGQLSFGLGFESALEVPFLTMGAEIDFEVTRAGLLRVHFFNDFQFALALTEDVPSFVQYHVGLALGF